MSEAEAEAGTATTERTINAAVLKATIEALAASSTVLTDLTARLDSAEDAIEAIPVPPVWDTLDGMPEVIAAGATKSAARAAIDAAAAADVADIATAAAGAAVDELMPSEVTTTAIESASSSELGLMSGRRFDTAYIARHVAYKLPWIVTYDGVAGAWPDISTVPLAIRNAAGVRIIWDSSSWLDVIQPPQMRERDRWRELVED